MTTVQEYRVYIRYVTPWSDSAPPPGGQAYLFQACFRDEYLILAYPYVGTTVGPRVIPNFGISSHQHPAEPWPLPGHHDSPTQLLHTGHTGHTAAS